MKPLTENMLKTLEQLAAHNLMGTSLASARHTVDGNQYGAIFRRGLIAWNAEPDCGDFLTEEALALVDDLRVMELVKRHRDKLQRNLDHAMEKVAKLESLLERTLPAVCDTGMDQVVAQVDYVTDSGRERSVTVWLLVKSSAEYGEVREAILTRMEEHASHGGYWSPVGVASFELGQATRSTFGWVTAQEVAR